MAAKEIQETLSNQFIGNCGVYSSTYGSSIFGKEEYVVKSTSASESYPCHNRGSNKTIGENMSMHERERVKAQEFADLDIGCFSGKVVESHGVLFQEEFKNVSAYDKEFKNESLKELPDVRSVLNEAIIANQRKIEQDINLLLVDM